MSVQVLNVDVALALKELLPEMTGLGALPAGMWRRNGIGKNVARKPLLQHPCRAVLSW